MYLKTVLSKLSPIRLSTFHSRAMVSNDVGIVLSGCGVYDGSEIHEASAMCVAITRLGKHPVFFAPNKTLHHSVNHINGESNETNRNVLIESGRIARGSVHPLQHLQPKELSALFFPGGFGVAKNLSTFGTDSENPNVDEEISRIIKECHELQIPMGFCCIAPILPAMILSSQGIRITFGKSGDSWPYSSVIEKARDFGALVEEHDVHSVCVDEENKIYSTPAFMYDGAFHEVHDGITSMVNQLLTNL